jgi:multidrug resistance efflux pump
MIVVITICYISCVLLAFKVIKIKVSPVSIAVTALTGVTVLGGVVIGWKFSAPMTAQMTVKRNVVPLLSAPDSKGYISKIYVPQNQPVKKGTPLYEYDTRPNEYALEQLTAQLAASRENISALQAGVEVAAASVEAAKASQAYAQAQLESSKKTQELNPNAVAELQVTVQEQKYLSSGAAVEQAIATQKEAEFALTSAKEASKEIQAQIGTAQLNVEESVVKATSDGYIMGFQAVEGTMGTSVKVRAQGSFMDMTETVVAAVFPQNLVQNVAPGDTVEIAFMSLPGQIATGKVDEVLEYTGEGQIEVSGVVPTAKSIGSKGFLFVRVLLDDQDLAKELPLGGAGTLAIYTKSGGAFHIISKIALRMKAWMYYAPI